MSPEEIISKLKNMGIKDPQIVIHDWGIYWFENDEETNKEGHVEGDDFYIWPWDEATLISGEPVLLE